MPRNDASNGPSAPDHPTGELHRLRRDLRTARLRLLESDRQLQARLESNSWQVIELLQHVGRRCPGTARIGLQAVKLIAWTALGQLGARARARRLSQQRRREEAPPDVEIAPTPEVVAASLTPPAPAPGGRTILIVDASIPRPDRSAGARTTAAFVTALLDAGWAVVFAPFDGLDAGEYTRALSAQGVLVVDGRTIGGIEAWLAAHGPNLDHVMLMRPQPARALLPTVLRSSDARISYYGHDLHFARLRRQAELQRDIDLGELADRELAVERQIWRVADVVLYPSAEEAAMVRKIEPDVDARAVPMVGFDTFVTRTAPPEGEMLLFVGGFKHPPNEDAVRWFVEAVLPLVRAVRPGVHLVLAGADPGPSVRALAGPGVEVTGYVTDAALTTLYDRARVVVAPLRFGAGVKGKVVEAMRLGVPVVTTTVGAQGLARTRASRARARCAGGNGRLRVASDG